MGQGQKTQQRKKRALKKKAQHKIKRKIAATAATERLNRPRTRGSMLKAAMPVLALASMMGS